MAHRLAPALKIHLDGAYTTRSLRPATRSGVSGATTDRKS